MATEWSTVVERNQVYSNTKHQPKPFLSELGGSDFVPPQVFIFSCMDFRASAEQLLDLKAEEAIICRNLGGRVKNNLHSLIYVDHATGGLMLKEVAVIHHIDCGLTHGTDSDAKQALKAKLPDMSQEIDGLNFGCYDGSNLEKHKASVQEDLDIFKSSPLVRKELRDHVNGYVYDIKSGKLIPVNA